MKKQMLLLVVMLMAMLPLQVKAESINPIELIKKIPSLNQGAAYSIADSQFNYLSTIDVVKWKGFNLEAGYAGRAKETGDKLVAVVSYELLSLKDKTTLPILDLVAFRPGLYAGVGRIGGSNEFDFGVSATVVSVKF